GASGSGKSTLVSLLSRLRDPDAGCVRINGVDIRSFTLDSLRSHVGVVGQHPVLFDGTLRQNLKLGAPMASDEALAEACGRAGLDEWLERLPRGLDTAVVAAGAQFSGGERQRLCIARALLVDAPILVLDEATSSIEPRAEGLLHSALEPVFRSRTTLAIAHRLSTVQAADRIVVLEDGAIVGGGRHEDLLSGSAAYRRFLGAFGEAHS
ncbi:MAG: ATP-binding cassette domain-containing protein, partial [Myxococcota bacterium]|nr:ATP-binding cassette domain-containing protein [Myxococcota bacterium]